MIAVGMVILNSASADLIHSSRDKGKKSYM